jgi:hypothetical protein
MPDVVLVVTAGAVALAFLVLAGVVVWRVTATVPAYATRILVSLATLFAALPPVLYALLSARSAVAP